MDHKTISLTEVWLTTVSKTRFHFVKKKRDGPSLFIMVFQIVRNFRLRHGLDFVTNV
jgi:hypothetical protein